MVTAELIVDPKSISDLLRAEWDALATGNRLPLMSPGWLMPWWRHAAPKGSELRVIIVRDGPTLIGIAPFFVVDGGLRKRTDYRLMGAGLSMRLAPLAADGRERDIADAIIDNLAVVDPHPDLIAFEAVPLTSAWQQTLREHWPSRTRPIVSQYHHHSCPTVSLHNESYDDWLAGKSSNFRGQMRRMRRQFEAAGGTTRMATATTLGTDVESFCQLHRSRWESVSHSSLVALDDDLNKMLMEVASDLLGDGRFRLWITEIDDQPISAQMFVAAGGEVHYFNGGWNERFAKYRPAQLGILAAIEDGFARSDSRLDLGPGQQQYKLRLADDDDPVGWSILIPPGRRLPLTAIGAVPMLVQHAIRHKIKRFLSPEQIDRLRDLRRGVGRS